MPKHNTMTVALFQKVETDDVQVYDANKYGR